VTLQGVQIRRRPGVGITAGCPFNITAPELSHKSAESATTKCRHPAGLPLRLDQTNERASAYKVDRHMQLGAGRIVGRLVFGKPPRDLPAARSRGEQKCLTMLRAYPREWHALKVAK
jgi:hypothetical protein